MASNKVLIVIGGGIGDQVCAEPTIRYALKKMPELKISIMTAFPEFFAHLNPERIFVPGKESPALKLNSTDYVVRGTYPDQLEDLGRALCSVHTNGVDYCAMMALKWNLPIADREIHLIGARPYLKKDQEDDDLFNFTNRIGRDVVILHPGRSWPSKTFPASWWDLVASNISNLGGYPVWVGAEVGPTGTVAVDPKLALDLRGKLSLSQLVWVLQETQVVLTNDSAPLHIAASTDIFSKTPWIGMLATAKHPDFLLQWRKGRLGWKMENLTKGGLWNRSALNDDVKNATEEEILSWLPSPYTAAHWAVTRLA